MGTNELNEVRGQFKVTYIIKTQDLIQHVLDASKNC